MEPTNSQSFTWGETTFQLRLNGSGTGYELEAGNGIPTLRFSNPTQVGATLLLAANVKFKQLITGNEPVNPNYARVLMRALRPEQQQRIDDFAAHVAEAAKALPTPTSPAQAPAPAVSASKQFTWSGVRMNLNVTSGGYAIYAQDTRGNDGGQQVTLAFTSPEEIPGALEQPENAAFKLVVIRQPTPLEKNTIMRFATLVNELVRELTPKVASPVVTTQTLNESVEPDRFYWVRRENGEAIVDRRQGFLLRENAENAGRASGLAEKVQHNRHQILTVTGKEVLEKGFKIE